MTVRQRAIHAEHKQERHDAILDAAERLLLRSPERLANVAEVAKAAGLAKGTVYLYFPGKEELLLALHERNVSAFFAELTALVARGAEGVAPSIDEMLELTRRQLLGRPLFLLLASRCYALMPHAIPAGVAAAYRQRMAERLACTGAALERHFPQLGAGDGVLLLRNSYALILGLWQLSVASADGGAAKAAAQESSPLAFSFTEHLDHALRALWRGMLGIGSGAAGARA
jgi:AcrR family transcriptional regulator